MTFLTIWLVVWSAAGAVAIAAAYPNAQAATLIFLLIWGVAEAWVAYQAAWLWFGDETLSVEAGRLQRALHIGPWVRRRAYDRTRISQLQPREIVTSRGPSLSGRDWSIQFKYGASTCRMARGLTEEEAQTVAALLSERLSLMSA